MGEIFTEKGEQYHPLEVPDKFRRGIFVFLNGLAGFLLIKQRRKQKTAGQSHAAPEKTMVLS
ncbi:hypothetical protein [Acutalibacter intestini]|uniref:hypothetical protein n=1 Tax=Acutalibacter intestini TaxID=3093659 RepID=UPI002AC92104|nr:hypothetical protein [Acutalibacter sp. M00204]